MNIIPVKRNELIKSPRNPLEGMTQYQDRPHQFNQEVNTPIISNLERNLAITGTLLMAYGTALPHYEIIARAHYFAQLAMTEAERMVNHDVFER